MSLIQEELCRILNDDLVVWVGQESCTNRIHKLFYSIHDETYYIAVQDEETGWVVTILPPGRSRWKVAPDAYSQAKALICGEKKVPVEVVPDDSSEAIPDRVCFIVYLKRGRRIVKFKVEDKQQIRLILNFDSSMDQERQSAFEQLLLPRINNDRTMLPLVSVSYRFDNKDPMQSYPYNLMQRY